MQVFASCAANESFGRSRHLTSYERLPAYTPEVNADEYVWGWSKYGRSSNLAAATADVLRDYVIDQLVHLQEHPELLASFIDKTKLRLAG